MTISILDNFTIVAYYPYRTFIIFMNKILTVVILFVLMVVPTLTFAQPPHVLWSTTFGGENNDYGYSVQETEDNGFILISKTESYGNGDNDVWLIKS